MDLFLLNLTKKHCNYHNFKTLQLGRINLILAFKI